MFKRVLIIELLNNTIIVRVPQHEYDPSINGLLQFSSSLFLTFKKTTGEFEKHVK